MVFSVALLIVICISNIGDDVLFLVVYVDDLIITGSSTHLITEIKRDMFRMQDCKLAFTPMETGLKLSTKYDSPLIDETQFRELVGNLIYLTTTRPDLSFAVSYISCFMTTPKANHWVATKRVLHYVKGTSDYGLFYTKSHDPTLSGYTDLDWASSVDDRKSTSGYVFSLGSCAVIWTSKK
ncbi:secreted RxLR effector protein 161-like [Cryptomeria japonica]|uniref:secreted RxLR effector protein 161-like n=1 Tax=Cryptomeria japonica TaxID=3369 RepID=UPI0025AD2C79|nr:secreted RxLR effector protein 161-like [Cryptomeria japonica]